MIGRFATDSAAAAFSWLLARHCNEDSPSPDADTSFAIPDQST